MKKTLVLSMLGLLVLLALPSTSVGSDSKTAKVFIHLTANFKENDGPVCVAFNAAWQALREGSDVEVFFYQDAAYGIKQWEPGKTDLGLYPLPARIKDLLVTTFQMKREALPANYQEYLVMLHKQGARVTVNGFWNALTQVEETIKGRKIILPYAETLTLQEFLAHRKEADVYLKF